MPNFRSDQEKSLAITLCLMMFCSVESFRYSFYFVKHLGYDNTQIGRILGWIRYNIFLFFYPIGAFSEGTIIYRARDVIREKEILSFYMPNKYNIAFDLSFFMAISPILYMFFFP